MSQKKQIPIVPTSKSSQQAVQNQTVKMEFDPSKYVKMNVSREEVLELKVKKKQKQKLLIKQAFDIFDDDGSGQIEPQELMKAFEQMGYHPHSKMIYQVLAEIDKDNSGGFGFEEFYTIATHKAGSITSRNEIDRVYSLFDLNKDGHVTWRELKIIAQALGEDVDDEWIKQQFNKVDLDRDGFVTADDFYNMMTDSKVYYN